MLMKRFLIAGIGIVVFSVAACSGSKKYFKAAEKLENKGFIDEAATYYQESLQRKPKNTDARLKLKEVGQKYVNNLSSQFFREYNTQQYEQAIQTYDKLKLFVEKSTAMSVMHHYPQSYNDDYNQALSLYLSKYYTEAVDLVNQGNYDKALNSISKVKKYNASYSNIQELEITAKCEPLYMSAIKYMEAKNYAFAQSALAAINYISSDYKDGKELIDLTDDLLKKSLLIFTPKNSAEKDIEEILANRFIESSPQTKNIQPINHSPFSSIAFASDQLSTINADLLQAIRKASGATFFYVFDVTQQTEGTSSPTKRKDICYEKVITKKDTQYITDYKPTVYYQIKAQRSYSYNFNYQVIDAFSNQVIVSKKETLTAQDIVDYYEFASPNRVNMANFTPYNPATTPAASQYNPSGWRNSFNNRKELRSISDLKNDVNQKAIHAFVYTLNHYLSK